MRGSFCVRVLVGPDVTNANRLALKTLARRVLELDHEIEVLDGSLITLVEQTASEMIERVGVGTDTAGALLVAAGENTSRIRNERSFARPCGAAPLDASSGKRTTTSAQSWWRPSSQQCRLADRHHPTLLRPSNTRIPPTPLRRRQTKAEAIRCLKRYAVRELYACLPPETLA
jgi:hypothetical protein